MTMLAMANRHGVVEAAVPGLAHAARVSLEDCRAALEKFQNPDLESRSLAHDGRRIIKIEGGWQLLNYETYRRKLSADERREYKASKQAEYRAKNKAVGYEEMTPEERRERVLEKIRLEEEACERVRAKHNPDYAAGGSKALPEGADGDAIAANP